MASSSSYCCFLLSNPSARLFACLTILTVAAWTTSAILSRTTLDQGFALDTAADEWLLVGGLTAASASFRIQVPSQGDANDASSSLVLTTPAVGGVDVERKLTPNVDQPNPDLFPRLYAITVSDLQPQTKYSYYLATGASQKSLTGSFQTPGLPSTRFNFTILASGCAWTGSKADIFNIMARDHAEDALFMLHLGDFHYQDLNTNNVATRVHTIANVLASQPQAELYRSLALVSIWDDHDYLGNDKRGFDEQEVGARNAALDSYQYAFPHYPLAGLEQANNSTNSSSSSQPQQQQPRPGIYQAFTIGTVRFLMSDLRSETTVEHIMSQEQKEWLTRELLNADQYDVVVWITSQPWIGDTDPGKNSWMGMPKERAEFSDLISTLVGQGPRNLIALSSDMHAVALDDGSHTYYGNSTNVSSVYSFPIVQLGPLDRLGSDKGGPFITGCDSIRYERTHQFATLEFTFDDVNGNGVELPCIRISTFRVNPQVWGLQSPGDHKELLFSYRFCGILFTPVGNTPGRTCQIDMLSTTGWGLTASGFLMALVVSIGASVLPQTSSWKTKFMAGTCTFLLVWVSYLGTVAIYISQPYWTRGIPQWNLQESTSLGLVLTIAMGFTVVLSTRCCAGCDRVPVTAISSQSSQTAGDKRKHDDQLVESSTSGSPMQEVMLSPSIQVADAKQKDDDCCEHENDLEVARVDTEGGTLDAGTAEEDTPTAETGAMESTSVEVTRDDHGCVAVKGCNEEPPEVHP